MFGATVRSLLAWLQEQVEVEYRVYMVSIQLGRMAMYV